MVANSVFSLLPPSVLEGEGGCNTAIPNYSQQVRIRASNASAATADNCGGSSMASSLASPRVSLQGKVCSIVCLDSNAHQPCWVTQSSVVMLYVHHVNISGWPLVSRKAATSSSCNGVILFSETIMTLSWTWILNWKRVFSFGVEKRNSYWSHDRDGANSVLAIIKAEFPSFVAGLHLQNKH